MKWAVMLVVVIVTLTGIAHVLRPSQLTEPVQAALAMAMGIGIGLWVIHSYQRGRFRLTVGTFPRKSSPIVFWLCVVVYSLISLIILAAASWRGLR